jgi:acetoin utilization protein AcuB
VNEKDAPIGIISWRDILRIIEINHNQKINKTKE